uniref:Uncharacterized protein n=1 Tax=Triticum urartu TaxID=4572 RepID=A0A8R7TZJ3_TRIUA
PNASLKLASFLKLGKRFAANQEQGKKSQDEGPSSSTSNGKEADEEADDDDDLDLDELNELEASLSRTSIEI